MRSNTPQEPTHLLTNPDDYLLSTGRFLRKYSLDEFPQIISIIKGDMVFVGPRPALFNQHDLISQRDQKGISQLKPGITGWAQVNGRDELSIEEKVQYDEEYLRRASMSFDIYIIWLTIIKVIKKDGISH
jgi:O-antigen biosynthesis protein WbqP